MHMPNPHYSADHIEEEPVQEESVDEQAKKYMEAKGLLPSMVVTVDGEEIRVAPTHVSVDDRRTMVTHNAYGCMMTTIQPTGMEVRSKFYNRR